MDGRTLRIRRLTAGFTQEELADLVGIDHSHLSKVERGERGLSDDVRDRIETLLAERAR